LPVYAKQKWPMRLGIQTETVSILETVSKMETEFEYDF